jgi:hypothetical protein
MESKRIYFRRRETRAVRKETTRERIAPLLARVDARTRRASAAEIRRAIREAVGAVRREDRQPRA